MGDEKPEDPLLIRILGTGALSGQTEVRELLRITKTQVVLCSGGPEPMRFRLSDGRSVGEWEMTSWELDPEDLKRLHFVPRPNSKKIAPPDYLYACRAEYPFGDVEFERTEVLGETKGQYQLPRSTGSAFGYLQRLNKSELEGRVVSTDPESALVTQELRLLGKMQALREKLAGRQTQLMEVQRLLAEVKSGRYSF